MANTIKPKRSAVAGNIPTTSNISQYEIAMNTADKKIYTSDGTSIIQLAAGELKGLSDVIITSPSQGQSLNYNSTTGKWVNSNAGTGDVIGPSSATDNALVRFDTTTGKLIQNSTVTLDDAGNMTGVVLDSYLNSIGSNHIHYRIKANVALVKGDLIKYVSWNAGEDAMTVTKVTSSSDVAIGMCDETIAVGGFGLASIQGVVEGFDTSAWAVNTILYPSASGLTATKPTSGTYQACAFVIRSQSQNGAVLVSFIVPSYVESSSNVGNTSVIRDVSGNFSAGIITANLSGNASTATKLYTARTLSLSGDVTGSTSFDGSANVITTTTLVNSGVTAGTYGSSTLIPTFTVDSKGRITSASTNAITVGNGTFGVSIGTAGATNTTVTWGTASGFSANTGTNYTYDLKVGPALTNLASTMTGATNGFIKKTGADTYSLDTSTYLTSYTEIDTLQSVTSRGNTTTTTITHGGLVMSSGTNVDQVYSVTDSLTLTTAWQDTSVNAAELTAGSYVVQLYVSDNAVGGGHYSTYYTGFMSWFDGDTNETSSDEIVLHRAGHASNSGKIYLRVLRTATADVANLKLQISGVTTNTGASNYQFKFRRLI